MGFGAIIIGDEILSGRRTDKHLPKIIELLSARGLALDWAEYIGDERERITATLKRAFASGDTVFSTGGIGATPDDHTRQCAAAALGVPLELHPEKEEWVERLLMRIEGVQSVRESKYIMLHAPRSALPEIRKLLPGSESPTIIPLEGHPDKVAIHAVCRENVFWETLESLKKAGASALLVLPVEKMLA